MVPEPDEWDTSNLPASRRAYLDKGISFEDIAASTVIEAQILKTWIRPLETPPLFGPGARSCRGRGHVTVAGKR